MYFMRNSINIDVRLKENCSFAFFIHEKHPASIIDFSRVPSFRHYCTTLRKEWNVHHRKSLCIFHRQREKCGWKSGERRAWRKSKIDKKMKSCANGKSQQKKYKRGTQHGHKRKNGMSTITKNQLYSLFFAFNPEKVDELSYSTMPVDLSNGNRQSWSCGFTDKRYFHTQFVVIGENPSLMSWKTFDENVDWVLLFWSTLRQQWWIWKFQERWSYKLFQNEIIKT